MEFDTQNVTNGYPATTIKPHRIIHIKPYDGTTPLEGFIAQFNIASQYNQWNEEDRLAHLKLNLNGTAMNILWEYTPDKLDTVDKVIEILTTRYGNNGLAERYRKELRSRRRQANETLSQLLQVIQCLTSLAFPGMIRKTSLPATHT